MAWAEQLDLGSPILGEAKTTLQLGRLQESHSGRGCLNVIEP